MVMGGRECGKRSGLQSSSAVTSQVLMSRWFQSPWRIKSVISFLGGAFLAGICPGCCSIGGPQGGSTATESLDTKAAPPREVENVSGKLMHLELEGGFWGLVTTTGEKLRLIKPPEGQWSGGEAVNARIRRLEDGPSIFQWGRPVELLSIERRAPPPRSE